MTTTSGGEETRPKDRESTSRVLLADDEQSLRRVLARELDRKGHEVVAVEDGDKAIAKLEREEFDVAVLDVRMPGRDGLEVLRALAEQVSPAEVIMLTGNATVELAVEAMKAGAYDFVTKPCRIEVLDALVRGAARKRALARENSCLKRREEHSRASEGVHGWNSAVMEPVLRLMDRLGPSEIPVLILGESGVGKELVAREIHRRSRRCDGPFVDLNCAAIPDTLLESELFGHEKGAFTGAEQARAGLLEAADGGTLFLDEIGELPGGLQVKLLRVLETMSFFRVGGRRKVEVDVRLVAATNRDLSVAAERGEFRTDLLYRINAGTIRVPPLRERREEIPVLAQAFLESVTSRLRLGTDVLPLLQAYRWPGNVRELRNVIERAALLAGEGEITRSELPREVHDAGGAPDPQPPARSADERIRTAVAVSARPPAGWDDASESLQELERRRIIEVLEQTHWHRGRAADILGISVRTLYRKIKAYDLDRECCPIT
jgi:DNA-binding NtrC family response regulator